jgi:translation initiation factor RLI1
LSLFCISTTLNNYLEGIKKDEELKLAKAKEEYEKRKATVSKKAAVSKKGSNKKKNGFNIPLTSSSSET